MGALQPEIERRGQRIFELVDEHPEPLFSKAGFYQRMMALSMRDEYFKVQLFRFVDVLASLHRGSDIVQHLDEYFADTRNGYAQPSRNGHRAQPAPGDDWLVRPSWQAVANSRPPGWKATTAHVSFL